MTAFDGTVLGIGSRMLHRLRTVLERDFGEQTGAALQEAGYAAGDELYDGFTGWLAARTGVHDPAELDARHLSDVLGEFFRGLGWGHLRVERVGPGGLELESDDWAAARAQATLSGRVSDSAGRPLAGAAVRARAPLLEREHLVRAVPAGEAEQLGEVAEAGTGGAGAGAAPSGS